MIGADSDTVVWAALAGIVAFGLWSERTALGRRLTGVIVVLLAAFLLSNLGVIPAEAAVYGTVMSNFIPLALALLLLRVDLRSLRREAGPTLGIFLVGAAGTMAGAVAAFFLIPIAAPKAELAGMFAATYIGGSANFAVVADAFAVTDGDILVPAIASDTIVTILYLVVLGAIPAMRFFQTHFRTDTPVASATDTTGSPSWLNGELDIRATALSLFAALAIVALGDWVQSLVDVRGVSVLTITVAAVLLATALPNSFKPDKGGFQLGMILMLIFFAALGATGSLAKLIEHGPMMLAFAGLIIFVHFSVTFGVGKLLNLDLAEIATASNACVCGPPTAAGMAADAGWDHLVTPGILAGSLGFAIANIAGVAIVNLLS